MPHVTTPSTELVRRRHGHYRVHRVHRVHGVHDPHVSHVMHDPHVLPVPWSAVVMYVLVWWVPELISSVVPELVIPVLVSFVLFFIVVLHFADFASVGILVYLSHLQSIRVGCLLYTSPSPRDS